MKNKTFYVTTPIYYPSGKLHIGHTYTTVAADAIARFKRFTGYDVKFLTGTDEHGEKIQKTAIEKGLSPKEYLDDIVEDIKKLWKTMDISYDDFIRTTEDRHKKIVQKIFTILYEKGDIYKSEYEGWYCTPCESFWTETQLLEGNKCPDCNREAKIAKEEAYFFKLSKYQDALIKHFEENPMFCYPESRKNEMLNNFLKAGLEDLCVSRTTFDWGIKVPFDEKHVIYVWFDAVCNYITALGYLTDDQSEYEKFWPANVHIVGKEIVRFHSIIWPAILMALEIPLPKQIFGHGWILFADDKMSKSKGNIVYPQPLIERYGIDALKYFLLREFTFGQDGSYTNRNFLNRINSNLCNDLGNLVSRTVAMVEKYRQGNIPSAKLFEGVHSQVREIGENLHKKVEENMDKLNFSEALEEIWKLVRRSNKYIDETMPWVIAKDEEKSDELDTVLYNLCESIRIIAVALTPFMELTSKKIYSQLGIENDKEILTWDSIKEFGKIKQETKVKKSDPLFPRIDIEKELEEMEKMFENKEQVKPLNHKEAITIDEFDKVEIRVGKVLQAQKHPKADKLLVIQLELGSEKRQIVSGIAKYYKPEELVGKNVLVVCNLKPVKLRGVESQGMILAAATDDDEKLVLPTVENMPSGGRSTLKEEKMLFDSHAHLDDERFDEDRDEVIKKIKSENVKYVLNAGADIASSKRSIHLSEKYDFIYASVGVHPHDVKDMNEDTINLLKTLSKHEKVVAIGEIGLDYYYENSPREIQKRWFERQIQLANEVKLPIIVHDRDAHKDTFDIIKTTKSKDIGCVLHCYSGSLELAKEYVKMGCFISIAGPVTFKNNVKTVEVIKKIPLEYLLIETDCPYLAPHPHRGKRNDPSYVRYIAEKIAIEKGISYEKVCEITTKNAKILFNI